MKEFYKTVVASMNGQAVKKTQGEIVAQQMVKNAIIGAPGEAGAIQPVQVRSG